MLLLFLLIKNPSHTSNYTYCLTVGVYEFLLMSINDNVYFVLMSCQWDAGEGSLCRDENNKDVFIFSTEE